MNIIKEAIEAAATQDLCGNHNSADLLRRLAGYITDEIAMSGALAYSLRGAMSVSYDWKPALVALEAHAKRREAGK